MIASNLAKALWRTPQLQTALENHLVSSDFTAPHSLHAPLAAGLYAQQLAADQTQSGVCLIVTATSREAQNLKSELESLLPETSCVELPAWETLPHERLSPARATSGQRYLAIAVLNSGWPTIVVASVRAVLQAVAPDLVNAQAIRLKPGSNIGQLAEFSAQLVQYGYERVDMVTQRGEFAVRGGLLDIFVPTAQAAVRIDLFDTEIESLSEFAVADQRSAQSLEEIAIWPARELLITQEVQEKAAALLRDLPSAQDEKTRTILNKISAGISCEAMESLLPQLVTQKALTQLLPQNSTVIVLQPEKVTQRAVSLAKTNEEFLVAAWQQAGADADAPGAATSVPVPLAQESGLYTLKQLKQLHSGNWHTIGVLRQDTELLPSTDYDTPNQIAITVSHMPEYSGQDTEIYEFLREHTANGGYAAVALGSNGAKERATEQLTAANLPVISCQDLPTEPAAGFVYVFTGNFQSGFAFSEPAFVVLTETELWGRNPQNLNAPKTTKPRSRSKNVVDPLQLKTGDFVVHERHGIGRFVELASKQVPGPRAGDRITREYLVLEYAASKRGMPADKLFVPTDQLAQLSRYVGAETPTLSKMGGSDWAAAKQKARRAVRDIAVQLVKLYAARAQAAGHAFAADSPWQQELEDAFAYVETRDQLQAIADVKRDMEQPKPMDRLILGDVGFGKTEIAVRAAFKAVQDNKQVAILVPTTLLVQQHYETFAQRFAGFPVRLRALSRFQTDKQAREIITGLQDGTVDVVIGTHRLLGKEVTYKDLGLIIIDEEQRFGVEHKDALKALKTNVDVLAMSATPIPRTLEMAVTGIREMSQLTTAPEDRHPILTFVGPKNMAQVAAAINREMLREGQVFYVHNRVQSIHKIAAEIAAAVPEARVAVAHGRLSQAALEEVVVDFWERKYDVLVCTTIIETGLDIANANTIIIDNADKYGLSQLHQLRGRVGRGRERAYAYFLYDQERILTEQAYERLETIARHNELGSGMQVALKDLELRGAGNLLGGEQSGHIAGVGFDLYLRMIGEAVATFKGEETAPEQELQLELPVAANIPNDYIDSERLRLEAYQKISAACAVSAAEDALELVRAELIDRYGPLPEAVTRLLQLSQMRYLAVNKGITKITFNRGVLTVTGWQLPDSLQMRLQRLYPGATYKGQTVTVPAPAALGGGQGLASRSLRAADQAADGDLTAWILRLFAALAPAAV